MKKNIIYCGMLFLASTAFTACSNLDESAFNITSTETDNVICSETFETGLGNFIQKSTAGSQTWTWNSGSYVTISAWTDLNGNGYSDAGEYTANEDWLISPVIDLTTVSAAKCTFSQVARYFADAENEATVWVSEGYQNDSLPTSVKWTQLKTKTFKDPGNWTFGSSGEISLTAYSGKKIRIAIKYVSTTVKAGTWEVKNFLVTKGEATVADESIFSNSFAYDKGNFTAISVSGNQFWTYSSQYACMVANGHTSVNNANEDWLVSPEIDLAGIDKSYLSFDHAGRYFGTPANEATVWVSENYTDSAHFSTATWIRVNVLNYFNNTSFTFVNSGSLDLSAFSGKKIHIALKYVSSTLAAGTWEVRNFQVFKGLASGIDANPFSVSEAVGSQSGGVAWVEGYIVGYSWPYMSQNSYYFNADSCSQKMNILLSDTISQNQYSSRCLAVQLPRGSIRNLLNLKENKSMLGKKVRIYGSLNNFMGISGMLNPTKYILPDGTSGSSVLTTIASESFGSSLGNFTNESKTGAQSWGFASGYGAKMSGFTTVNNENEDWLYSPEIDLTNLHAAALSFDQTINKGISANMRAEQTLWISIDNGTSWTQIAIPTYPAGNSWSYVNSGEIDLDAYAGKKIKIAFKYTSTAVSSATWEIKNFLIYN